MTPTGIVGVRAPSTSIPDPIPSPGSGNLFNSGWEFSTGTSFEAVTDNHVAGGWDDYGGSEQSVQTAIKIAGNNALRVQMPPGFGTNGPDFRIDKPFAPQTVIYLRWYQFFSANYFFRQSDHKMMILGTSWPGQEVYAQLRGNAGNTTFRLCVHIPNTGVFNGVDNYGLWECLAGPGSALGRGVWHRFEIRGQTGAGGGIQYRVGGVAGAMTDQMGTGQSLSNMTHGINNGAPVLQYFKWDTTYNGYDDAAVQGATPFNTYVDAVSLGNQTWIGA